MRSDGCVGLDVGRLLGALIIFFYNFFPSQIYEEMKRKCATVSVEVRKSQHKYVIGSKGSGIADILFETGVSVEMPPSDSDKETITLRGPQDKLGSALTKVYEKANSVCSVEVVAPLWIHRHIIGKKGMNIRSFTQDYPKVAFFT